MKTPCIFIVPIDVDRETIQEFDGRTYRSVESFKLDFQEKTENYDYQLHTLKDFVRMVNDDLGFDDVNNWIGYVFIDEDFNTLL
jgi:hypothetical protein